MVELSSGACFAGLSLDLILHSAAFSGMVGNPPPLRKQHEKQHDLRLKSSASRFHHHVEGNGILVR